MSYEIGEKYHISKDKISFAKNVTGIVVEHKDAEYNNIYLLCKDFWAHMSYCTNILVFAYKENLPSVSSYQGSSLDLSSFGNNPINATYLGKCVDIGMTQIYDTIESELTDDGYYNKDGGRTISIFYVDNQFVNDNVTEDIIRPTLLAYKQEGHSVYCTDGFKDYFKKIIEQIDLINSVNALYAGYLYIQKHAEHRDSSKHNMHKVIKQLSAIDFTDKDSLVRENWHGLTLGDIMKTIIRGMEDSIYFSYDDVQRFIETVNTLYKAYHQHGSYYYRLLCRFDPTQDEDLSDISSSIFSLLGAYMQITVECIQKRENTLAERRESRRRFALQTKINRITGNRIS